MSHKEAQLADFSDLHDVDLKEICDLEYWKQTKAEGSFYKMLENEINPKGGDGGDSPKDEYGDMKKIIDNKVEQGVKDRFKKQGKHKSGCDISNKVDVELIWNYWMEEGMLFQSVNAICMRIQNISLTQHNPLGNLALTPLRGASNLLWGYIQNQYSRLTIQRRTYEYESEYGLRLLGAAIPQNQSVESRSQFISAFNDLLVKCGSYFRQLDNRLMRPDPFPILSALQDVASILAEGKINQFGNMALESRKEMLMEQVILSKDKVKDFLQARALPYPEEWMRQLDAMKKIMSWHSTSSLHYYNLATYGEKLLLTIRNTDWNEADSSIKARVWATLFRDEIQKYVFSYRAVTGVDLSTESSSTAEDRSTIPAILIQRIKRN